MTKTFNIGELDKLVTLQSCARSASTDGAKSYIWTTVGQVYAKVERSVAEVVSDYNLESGNSLTIYIYSDQAKELTTRWRVLVDGKPYAIQDKYDYSRYPAILCLILNAIK